MAIWDTAIESEKVKTASADSNKCPSCGSNLFFNEKTGKLSCKYCGYEIYPEYFEISDLFSHVGDDDSSDADKNEKMEIVCNSCGSTVVTDHNTAATFCAFCGSPALVTGRLSKGFKPDLLIPFKVSRSEAEAKFKKWSETKAYLPKDFTSDATLKKITGLYVPFWLINADCSINIEGLGTKEDSKAIYYYEVKRSGSFKMRGVPFDGSKHISDRLMESIEPFDYSEAVPFNTGYLQGYYAERYDLSAKDMAKRISDRFRDYMYEERKYFVKSDAYTKVSFDMDKSSSKNYECNYALMPVWFLNYEYEGLYYKIAINGQTGEIAGNAPTDTGAIKRKKMLKYVLGFAPAIIMALLLIIGSYMLYQGIMTGQINGKDGFWAIFTAYAVEWLLMVFAASNSRYNFIYNWIEKQFRKVKAEADAIGDIQYKMPPAETYINSADRVELEKVDRAVSVTAKLDDNRGQRVLC